MRWQRPGDPMAMSPALLLRGVITELELKRVAHLGYSFDEIQHPDCHCPDPYHEDAVERPVIVTPCFDHDRVSELVRAGQFSVVTITSRAPIPVLVLAGVAVRAVDQVGARAVHRPR
jgi:hypothetical protein